MNTRNLDFSVNVDYHYGKFPPEKDKLNFEQLFPAAMAASDALARYDQMLKNLKNSEILVAPLRKQEAVISSRMEGTVSSMEEILRYEADYEEGAETTSSHREDTVETYLYTRALKSAQNELEEGGQISSHLIRAIHGRLLSFGRGAEKSPGKYKTEQNYVTDKTKTKVLFTPINEIQLNSGLEKLFSYLENDNNHILLKTAIAHIEFEALHPFQDGNGRVGRMLITLMLWKYGAISAPHFYISGYMEENKGLYTEAMRNVSKTNEWTNWCLFFLNAIEKQALRNLEMANKIHDLYESMQPVFREKLGSRWYMQALDFMFAYPIFRNNKFTNASGIPKPTAKKFTPLLLENQFLFPIEESSGQRAALYAFAPLMEIIRL